MRMENIDTPAENLVEDMLNFSDHYSDRAYIETLAKDAGPTLRWVNPHGVEFDYLPTMFLTSAQPRLLPVGGGSELLLMLYPYKQEVLEYEIIYESTAWDLILE